MTQVRCVNGVIYEDPHEAYLSLLEMEHRDGDQRSIFQCRHCRCWHVKNDGGRSKDIAHSTKYAHRSRAEAKRTSKDLRGLGRKGLDVYRCWYSHPGDYHYHLGHPPGLQTYIRPGYFEQ